MSDILEKYGLVFKNKVSFGENRKVCESEKYPYLASHLDFWNIEYLEYTLKEVKSALEGKDYNSSLSMNDFQVEINPTVCEIEYDVKIPTGDYRDILTQWINFYNTPPLSRQKMPYRSDVLKKYGIEFIDKKIKGATHKYCEGIDRLPTSAIVAHLIAIQYHERHSSSTILDEIRNHLNWLGYKKEFPGGRIEIFSASATVNGASIPLEDYRSILWEWAVFIETPVNDLVKQDILKKYNLKFGTSRVGARVNYYAMSADNITSLTLGQLLYELTDIIKIRILIFKCRFNFFWKRSIARYNPWVAIIGNTVFFKKLENNSEYELTMPRKDFQEILIAWKDFLRANK